jgi:hypothetical protein
MNRAQAVGIKRQGFKAAYRKFNDLTAKAGRLFWA